MRYVLALDMGGTNLKAAAVTLAGKIVASDRAESRVEEGKEAVLRRIGALLRRLGGRVGRRGLLGVGIGCPGPVDRERGVIVIAPNLKGWRNVPLGEVVRKEVGSPTVVENDANAAALGEYWLGAGRGYHSMILLTLGTGVGGGIVLDGKVLSGFTGMAGEVGHLTLFPEGRRCGCGNHGCLETEASATGTVRRVVEALRRGRRSALLARYRAGTLAAKDIHDAAKKGDRLAVEVLAETGRALGIAIAGLANVLNPEAVVLGGGLANAGRFIFGPLRAEVRRRALRPVWKRLVIAPAKLGEDAGVLGAAKAAIDRLGL